MATTKKAAAKKAQAKKAALTQVEMKETLTEIKQAVTVLINAKLKLLRFMKPSEAEILFDGIIEKTKKDFQSKKAK